MIDRLSKLKTRRNIYGIVILLLSFLFILPYACVVFYSLPRNDEFASAFYIICYGGYSPKAIIKFVANMYMTWEGNFTGHFLYSAFNPLLLGGIDTPVYIVNIICFALLTVLCCYSLYNIFKVFNIDKYNCALITTIAYITLLNCRFMRETYAWFTGITYYTLEIYLGMITTVMVCKLCLRKEKATPSVYLILILCCIISAFSAAGCLEVSAINCWSTLLLVGWSIYEKKHPRYAIALFSSTLLFTLIDLASPAYYGDRKDKYEYISLFKAAGYTCLSVYREIVRILTETYIPYILLIVFFMMFFLIRQPRQNKIFNPCFVGFAGSVCVLLSTFPVVYGYGRPDLYSRGYEIIDIIVVVYSFMFICCMVNWLKLKGLSISREQLLIMVTFFVLIFCTTALRNLTPLDLPSAECWIKLGNGTVKDYSMYWRNVIHDIEESKDSDVVIKVPEYYMEQFMIDRIMLQEDATNWVNTSASVVYGKDSITVVVEKEDK